MKFSIKNLYSKCEQSRSFLCICMKLRKKSSFEEMDNFILWAVLTVKFRSCLVKRVYKSCRVAFHYQ